MSTRARSGVEGCAEASETAPNRAQAAEGTRQRRNGVSLMCVCNGLEGRIEVFLMSSISFSLVKKKAAVKPSQGLRINIFRGGGPRRSWMRSRIRSAGEPSPKNPRRRTRRPSTRSEFRSDPGTPGCRSGRRNRSSRTRRSADASTSDRVVGKTGSVGLRAAWGGRRPASEPHPCGNRTRARLGWGIRRCTRHWPPGSGRRLPPEGCSASNPGVSATTG